MIEQYDGKALQAAALRNGAIVDGLTQQREFGSILEQMHFADAQQQHQPRFGGHGASRARIPGSDKFSDEERPWPNLDDCDDLNTDSAPPNTINATACDSSGDATIFQQESDRSDYQSPAKSDDLDMWTKACSFPMECSSFRADGGNESHPPREQNHFSCDLAKSDFVNPPGVCQGCKRRIEDRYLLNIGGLSWHEGCASCAICRVQLSNSCFLGEGRLLYCKEDYERIRRKCAGCSALIEQDEMVMRVSNSHFVHHVACFACAICKRLLRKGDEFIYNNHNHVRGEAISLQCKPCWSKLGEMGEESCIESAPKTISHPDRPTSTHTMSPGRTSDVTDSLLSPKSVSYVMTPLKSDDEEGITSDEDSTSGQLNSSKDEIGEDGKRSRSNGDGKDSKRSKRPRTILNAVQRRAFKAAFEVTPKPCRKVRETLAKDTGLTVRVVQVWFQNQRAKMKKLAKRQQSQEAAAMKAREEFGFHPFDPLNPMMHPHLPAFIRDNPAMFESMHGYINCNQQGALPGLPYSNVPCEQMPSVMPGIHQGNAFCDGVSTYYDGPPNVTVMSPNNEFHPNQMAVLPMDAGQLYQNNMLIGNGREDGDVISISPLRHQPPVLSSATPINSLYSMHTNYFDT